MTRPTTGFLSELWIQFDLSTVYPLVSLIILTYNGRHLLERNLPPVTETEYPNLEVLLIDNISSDGTANYVHDFIKPLFEKNNIKFTFFRTGQNVGIAEGRNIGIKRAAGKYIAFLDNDAKGDKNWLKRAIEVMEQNNSIGIIQCKALFMDGKSIDHVGFNLYCTGLIWKIGHGEQEKHQYDCKEEYSLADGPGLVFRKDIFNDVGPFDTWLAFAGEYGDISWRTWMSGFWRIVFVPQSIVYHEGSRTRKSSNVKSLYFSRWTIIYLMLKNYDTVSLFLYFPPSLLFLLLRGLSRRAGNYLYAYVQVLLFMMKNSGQIMIKRREVQKLRKVSTRRLIRDGIIKTPDSTMFKKAF